MVVLRARSPRVGLACELDYVTGALEVSVDTEAVVCSLHCRSMMRRTC